MKILVASCDNHVDTFLPFHECLERFYPTHPPVVYSTETVTNPYYQTISKNYPIQQWTRRIRETLEDLKNEYEILFMVDDCFIRKQVDLGRIVEARKLLHIYPDIACINFEKAYDTQNDVIYGISFLNRRPGAPWRVSIQCGLWNREHLMDVLSEDMDPWSVERRQPAKGYRYLINGGDYIIDYGYRFPQYMGIHNECWCREAIDFFEREGIPWEKGREIR